MAGHKVFISYSRRDAAYVGQLVHFLHEHHVPVWADNAINHGDHWEDVIVAEIDDCAAFVPVMTPEAWSSAWVRNEVARARAKDKPILPLLLRGEHFFGLSHLEAEDVSGGTMPGPAYVDRLRGLVEGDPVAQPSAPRPFVPARRRPRWLLPAVVALAVLAVVGTAVAVVGRYRGDAIPGAGPDRSGTPGATSAGTAVPEGDVVEHLASPEQIGPLTLFYSAPDASKGSASFGFQLEQRTESVYLLYNEGQNTAAVSVLAAAGRLPRPDLVLPDYLVAMDRSTLVDANHGQLPGTGKCGTLAGSDKTLVSCVWADPGSLGQMYCYFRSQADCAALFPQVRDAILKRG
jgi:hypothetical protein